MAAFFLAPALVVLGVWVVYPAVYTIVRSFFGPSGYLGHWVGIDNYKTLFTTRRDPTAIKNNAIWVAVVPAFVTAIGLIFAVLTERMRWSVAFKTAVFMPMAISAFATRGDLADHVSAGPVRGARSTRWGRRSTTPSTRRARSRARARRRLFCRRRARGVRAEDAAATGRVARLGLTAIPPTDVPASAKQAALPASKPGAITGVVWRGFKPGGGTPGKVEQGELGLPGVIGGPASRHEGTHGPVGLEQPGRDVHVLEGARRVVPGAIGAQTFARPWAGIAWLGPSLITPAS